jgi:hypothetical protein
MVAGSFQEARRPDLRQTVHAVIYRVVLFRGKLYLIGRITLPGKLKGVVSPNGC